MGTELILLHGGFVHTILLSKDNEAARRSLWRRIVHTLRKATTLPTKLAKESELVLLTGFFDGKNKSMYSKNCGQ